MQLELKYRRHLEDLIREKQETLNLRNRFQKDAENEAEKLKRAEEERLKFAASLREDILKRAANKNEQQKVF